MTNPPLAQLIHLLGLLKGKILLKNRVSDLFSKDLWRKGCPSVILTVYVCTTGSYEIKLIWGVENSRKHSVIPQSQSPIHFKWSNSRLCFIIHQCFGLLVSWKSCSCSKIPTGLSKIINKIYCCFWMDGKLVSSKAQLFRNLEKQTMFFMVFWVSFNGSLCCDTISSYNGSWEPFQLYQIHKNVLFFSPLQQCYVGFVDR